jgi:mRNA interferase HigB
VRIHLVRRETVVQFISMNPNSRVSFIDWLSKIKFADWEIPSDIGLTFPKADILGQSTSRVVFNIGGNQYRLIAKYYFGETKVHLFICWIGSHAEYDKLCKEGKQYTIHNY